MGPWGPGLRPGRKERYICQPIDPGAAYRMGRQVANGMIPWLENKLGRVARVVASETVTKLI